MSNNVLNTNQLPNRTVDVGGQPFLYFSGTAYLGLSQNETFRALIEEGQKQYGTVYGSSRNGNIELGIYDEAEHKLAEWVGAGSALTMSSGMLAGQAVVRQLMLEGYNFVYSPDAHPAIWHLPQIEIPKLGFEEWAKSISKALPKLPVAIVSNSVDALRGKKYSFEWVNDLPLEVPIVLVIDDSHGLGITGQLGAGIYNQIPKRPNIRLIVTASLAKGMSLAGGVIFSDQQTLQSIRNSAYFGSCSPMAASHLYAYLNADELYEEARQKLAQNTAFFQRKVADLELFSFTENYPVCYTNHDNLYDFLLTKNMVVYSFAYPKPTDKANTRIIVSAWHSYEDIDRLGEACRDFVFQQSIPCQPI